MVDYPSNKNGPAILSDLPHRWLTPLFRFYDCSQHIDGPGGAHSISLWFDGMQCYLSHLHHRDFSFLFCVIEQDCAAKLCHVCTELQLDENCVLHCCK